MSSKNRIYGRYLYSRYGKDPVIGSQNILTSNRGFDIFDQGAAASDTYTFTPKLLNSLIFSYNRNNATIDSGAPFSWTDLGIPVASTTPPGVGAHCIRILFREFRASYSGQPPGLSPFG